MSSELFEYLAQNEGDFRKARLPALYSDFTPQRTLNPDGYAANVAAWKRGLSAALLSGHAPTRSPHKSHFVLELDDSLLRSLESKQLGQPLALGAVLAEAVGNGEMIPRKQFLASRESIYYKSWGSLGWKVAKWGLRQAGLVGAPGADGKMPKGQFVVLSNLETGAKSFGKVTSDRVSRFERTFSKAHFKKTFENGLLDGQTLSEADFEVLLKFLTRDKEILATDGNIVKIRTSETEGATITAEDSAIANLKELMEDLTKQTEVLSRRIEELSTAAKEAVMKKNMVSARAALKSKKLAETNLSNRYSTLHQLEEVAAKIEEASDNVQLVKVMQSSTTALKSLNTQVGGADKVDAVFDALREQMGEVDEVGNIIAESGPTATVDDAEVDEEFEAMLAEEREKEEEIERKKKEAEESKQAEETRKRLADWRLGEHVY
ncbi:Snf7-domain-containing protein [Truncatella angustata]|uniref:Snf7-domain-containing protein n=1 Tax=Truncatella angustata TaxID=152316 RepID=A0A9P9A3U9_9PEZI|nr:Snf7-domain-containing protein [Truncatella angustata]KAH6660857.1 Snf7-domain-containing protein [Truncatella angustata]